MKKKLCMANTWLQKQEKKKTIYRASRREREIDFVLKGKKDKSKLGM